MTISGSSLIDKGDAGKTLEQTVGWGIVICLQNVSLMC